MNTLPVTAAHSAHPAVNPRIIVLVGAVLGIYLLGLWVKSKLLRNRLTRAVTRCASLSGFRRRGRSLGSPRMLARAGRSRRATWRFRKTLLISALIAGVWYWTQLHTHTP